MINYHQASNKINSPFYMKQLLKFENYFFTTGFEPVSSDCKQEALAARKREGQASGKCSNAGDNLQFVYIYIYKPLYDSFEGFNTI